MNSPRIDVAKRGMGVSPDAYALPPSVRTRSGPSRPVSGIQRMPGLIREPATGREQRYRVDNQTYGVMMIGGNESQLVIGLIRSVPPGTADQTDVDRISSVEASHWWIQLASG